MLATGITTTSYTASSLTADVVYTFKVTARTLVGLGTDSTELSVRAAAKPSVLAAPTTSVNTNVSVTITWSAPSNGGSAITAYTVAIRQSDGSTFTTESANCNVSTTTCTVPISVLQASPYNLAWGASIYATVLATNVVGSSSASTSGNGAVITTNPDPPSSLANNAAITSASIIALTWTAPTVIGGTAVVDYRISWDQGSSTYAVLASGITTASYSTSATLTANTVYKFKVESRNAFGFSTTYSNEVSIRAASLPTAPQSLANNVAVTASGIVGLTWSAASSDGGSPVIDYQISSKIGAASYFVLATGITTTSYTASSLTADVVYTFKVTARTLIGLGTDSTELSVRAAAKPSVLAAPTTSVNTNISVTITWSAPSNGGSAITAYTVAIRQSDGSTFTTESANCNVSTTTCTVPISVLQASPYNLAWGASIYATVLATNVVGSSSASTSGNGAVITTNPDPPSSLANNAAITSASIIALTWTAPTVIGGTAVVDYRISWDQGSSTYAVLASGITTASYSTSATLTANTVYKFKVESRNAFGFSTTYSNEVSIRAASLPTAPQTLANNVAVTASGIVGLTWSAASSDGGSPVIDY